MKAFLKFIFFGISKGPGVEVFNPETDERLALRVGFNMQFFLFSSLLGIPLFLKGMWKWGLFMFAVSYMDFYFRYQKMKALYNAMNYRQLEVLDVDSPAEGLIAALMIVCSVLLGIKGNEWRGKELLKKGWRFVNPEHEMAKKAVKKWKLSRHYLRPVKKRKETL